MRNVRIAISAAYCLLALIAVAAAAAHVLDANFRIGNLPPGLVATLGFVLLAVGVAWAAWTARWSYVVRGGGMAIGLLAGAIGFWGTSVVMGDCSRSGATASVGNAYMASTPAGLTCLDVLPSLLIGWYLIAVGIASLVALLVRYRYGDRFEADPALD